MSRIGVLSIAEPEPPNSVLEVVVPRSILLMCVYSCVLSGLLV